MTNGQLASRLQPTRTRPVSDLRMRGSKCASMAQVCRASLNACVHETCVLVFVVSCWIWGKRRTFRVGNSCLRWSGGIVMVNSVTEELSWRGNNRETSVE